MNSRHIQYALKLYETRNFSQAADELGISQPALSKQIISLENELGVKLFERNTVPLSLTPAGEFFISKAEGLLFEESIILKTLDRYKSGEYGKLTIGISPFRSLYLMPPLIKTLKARYPNLHIALCEHSRAQLHKGIAEGLYDFIITNLPIDDAKLHAEIMEKDELVLAVPDKLLSLVEGFENCKNGTPDCYIEMSQCKNLPFVVLHQSQELRHVFDKLCRLSRVDAHIYMEVTGINTAWTMVQAGLAATILPKQFLGAYDLTDEVTLFRLKQDSYLRQPAIVTRRGQYISEYAQFAIKLLLEKDNNFLT